MDKKVELEKFHRQRILSASRKLFGERNREQVTMDDIAKAADYSKATLYVYFKNKDEIYYIILLERMKELYNKLLEIVGGESRSKHQYVAACLLFAKFYEENPYQYKSICEIMTSDQELQNRSSILDKLYQVSEDIYSAIGVIFQNGIIDGSFKENIPELSTSLIHFAALSGIIELVSNKQIYIRRRTGMDKDQFLKLGFKMMLSTVTNEELVNS